MTFLNAILLGGLAAASIPIIIHLLHKNRFKVVKWAAMHLLEPLQRKRRRRIQIEQLLLLLVRCLIPATLALLMARPVLTGMRALMGAAKTSIVIALDNSYSMDAGTKNRSTFTEARDTAGQIIRHLGRGSEVGVVLMGGAPAPLLDEPTYNTDRADRELRKLQSGYGSAAAPASLELGAGMLGKMHEVQRELVVISDFQKISWGQAEDAERARVAMLLKKLPLTPRVTFIHVGREDKNNVSVQSLDFSRFLLGVGQRFQVRANLKNHGETAYQNLRVYFKVDNQERGITQIALGPHETGQVLFTHTFETAGSHVIAVETDAPDLLKQDNALLAAVPVWDSLPVLLVNGNPGRGPLEGETDFLEIALRPYASTKGTLADLVTTTVIAPNGLNAAALKDKRVVVLANVAELSRNHLKLLEDFVHTGGGLLVFPGDRIKTAWYNTQFHADGNGLLPWRLATLEGSLDDNAPHAAILVQHFEHPALSLFNDPRHGNLAAATVRLWYKFSESGSPAPSGAAKTNGAPFVLARLSTGDPYLIEKKFGEGTVIVSSVPCSAGWSNLPMRPVYLPLMQQLVTYLAAKFAPPRNVDIGQPLIAVLPAALSGKTLELSDPDGRKHKLIVKSAGGRALATFTDTRRPGLYILELPDKTPVHFVVNTTRAESDLAQLTADEIKAVAKPFNADVVRSWDEYRRLEQRRRYGRDLWRPLLWALLGLVFVEMALQQRITRSKR
ncbi:MAG: VWA domain-containing protein [Verrucomicrobia bacterium]|nr:VWA domain-containing protein [Verrucomicrobiota bacterium]